MIEIDDQPLTLGALREAWRQPVEVTLSDEANAGILRSAETVRAVVAGGGFGVVAAATGGQQSDRGDCAQSIQLHECSFGSAARQLNRPTAGRRPNIGALDRTRVGATGETLPDTTRRHP